MEHRIRSLMLQVWGMPDCRQERIASLLPTLSATAVPPFAYHLQPAVTSPLGTILSPSTIKLQYTSTCAGIRLFIQQHGVQRQYNVNFGFKIIFKIGQFFLNLQLIYIKHYYYGQQMEGLSTATYNFLKKLDRFQNQDHNMFIKE